jgi:hypothetical protein
MGGLHARLREAAAGVEELVGDDLPRARPVRSGGRVRAPAQRLHLRHGPVARACTCVAGLASLR